MSYRPSKFPVPLTTVSTVATIPGESTFAQRGSITLTRTGQWVIVARAALGTSVENFDMKVGLRVGGVDRGASEAKDRQWSETPGHLAVVWEGFAAAGTVCEVWGSTGYFGTRQARLDAYYRPTPENPQ